MPRFGSWRPFSAPRSPTASGTAPAGSAFNGCARRRRARGSDTPRTTHETGRRCAADRRRILDVRRPAQPGQRRRTVRPALRHAPARPAGAARDRPERPAAVLLQDLDRVARERRRRHRAGESTSSARRPLRPGVRAHLSVPAADSRHHLQPALGREGAGHAGARAAQPRLAAHTRVGQSDAARAADPRRRRRVLGRRVRGQRRRRHGAGRRRAAGLWIAAVAAYGALWFSLAVWVASPRPVLRDQRDHRSPASGWCSS